MIGRWVRGGVAALAWAALALGCESEEATPADAGEMAFADEGTDAIDAALDSGVADAMPDMANGMIPDGMAADDMMADMTPDMTPEPDLGPDLPPDRGVDPHPTLRMNHIQVRGTHNSYHIARERTIPQWEYTHEPLAVQLGRQGVRQFELDIHWHPEVGGYRVYHLRGIDNRSTCDLFVDCLAEIDRWLRLNPEAGPVMVLVEPKDDVDEHLVVDYLPELDAEVRAAMAPWRLLEPDEVRGEHPDLRTAVLADGWPSLHAARGQAYFVLLDTGETRDAYVADDPTLAGRVFFAPPDDEDFEAPYAAVYLRDGAVADAEGTRALAGEGFIVRTRADDAATLAVAIESGAHAFSTDYPDELTFEGGAALRCNPVSAPVECVDWLDGSQ